MTAMEGEEEKMVRDGMMGLAVGDALGVPVEFRSRRELKENPVVDMREYGTHSQPRGTWSDDSSMTFALMDSLCAGIDYCDMMERFVSWVLEGRYTATGKCFDIGRTTAKALGRYKNDHREPLECGGDTQYENGNGSLMRILPIVLYAAGEESEEKKMELVHNVSRLTHAHRRSLMGCGIYAQVVWEMLREKGQGELFRSIQNGMDAAFGYYSQKREFQETAKLYEKVRSIEALSRLEEKEISGSGYVIHTLEAALWCLATTHSYKECVLRAVNLGEDTDTVGAVAGSLAGLWYGMERIPREWLEATARRDWILERCGAFENTLKRRGILV